MRHAKSRTLPGVWLGALFGVAAAWFRPAFSASVATLLSRGVEALPATTLVYGAAAALSVGRLLARRRLGELRALFGVHFWPALGVVCAGVTTNLSLFQGLRHGQVTLEAIISRTDMLWSILIGRIIFGDRIRSDGAIGVGLMVTGALVASESVPWLIARAAGSSTPAVEVAAPAMWFFLSAFGVSVNAAFIKHLLSRGVRPTVVFTLNTGAVTVASAVLGSLLGYDLVATLGAVDGTGLLWVALAALLAMGSIELQYASLRHLPLWTSRAFALLTPATALVFGVLLGEQITTARLAGVGLVLAGGLIAIRSTALTARGE